jgi:hypothetical protein
MRELLRHLSKKSEGDSHSSSAKLDLLLFYCDFTAYRRLGRSITGRLYKKSPFGPVAQSVGGLRRSSFLEEERRVCDEVIDKFWDSSAREMTERLDDFMGWKVADFYEVVPYETVLVGEPGRIASHPEIEFCKDLEGTLADQLDQVSDENRHDEIDTGSPVGHEIW